LARSLPLMPWPFFCRRGSACQNAVSFHQPGKGGRTWAACFFWAASRALSRWLPRAILTTVVGLVKREMRCDMDTERSSRLAVAGGKSFVGWEGGRVGGWEIILTVSSKESRRPPLGGHLLAVGVGQGCAGTRQVR
jgi:hypothetical protein